MKKLTLILCYLGVWAFTILEHLYISIISYHKARIVVGLYITVLLVVLPYILFRILTEFGVERNRKWYIIVFSGFLFAIVYFAWTNKVDNKRLKANSRETTGVVYKAWISRRKHLVRVRYSIGNKEFTTFSYTDHKKVLGIGDTVTIIYWPRNPELYRIKFRNQ
jgi:hypothetical protein